MAEMNKKPFRLLFASLLTGVSIAVIYELFIGTVEHAQDFLWFSVGKTDEYKIMAIPMAVLGGLAIAAVLRVAKARGYQEIGHTISELLGHDAVTGVWVARTLVIGFVSLVAGASLGPEAVLIPVAYGVGYLIAKAVKSDTTAGGLMGIIALLAAFFNAYAAALIPLAFALAARKKDAKTIIGSLLAGGIAAGSSIAVLRIIKNNEGYVALSLPTDLHFTPLLLGAAVVIAALCTLIPFALTACIGRFHRYFDRLPKQWVVQGTVAGLGVGLVYFLIGPVGFFSGHSGLSELLQNNSEYTSLQLAGLAAGKLLVTAWSAATIYRGGLVFPQLVIAMSLALLLSGGIPNDTWLVTLLASSFFGVFTGTLGSLLIAAAFIWSLFGLGVLPVVVAAAVGSYGVKRLFAKRFAQSNAL